jgi:hypothetical protein
VEVDVRVTLDTGDGTVAETFAAQLIAYTSDIAALYHDFDADALARIYARQPGIAPPALLQLAAVFTRYGILGGLYSEASGQVAQWPQLYKCGTGVPILDATVQPSTDDLLKSVRGDGSMTRVEGLKVLSTVPVTLTPRPVEGGACYWANSIIELDDGLEAAIQLELKPRTGPALTVPMRLAADLGPGGVLAVPTMGDFGPCAENNLLSVDEFVQQCGDWGVDLRPFHGAHLDVSDNEVRIYGDGGTNCRRTPDPLIPFHCDDFEFVLLADVRFGVTRP